MADLVHFKFGHDGSWHRFALPTRGRKLFPRLKKRVNYILGVDEQRLWWDDGETINCLNDSVDLQAAIGFAEKEGALRATVPCINIYFTPTGEALDMNPAATAAAAAATTQMNASYTVQVSSDEAAVWNAHNHRRSPSTPAATQTRQRVLSYSPARRSRSNSTSRSSKRQDREIQARSHQTSRSPQRRSIFAPMPMNQTDLSPDQSRQRTPERRKSSPPDTSRNRTQSPVRSIFAPMPMCSTEYCPAKSIFAPMPMNTKPVSVFAPRPIDSDPYAALARSRSPSPPAPPLREYRDEIRRPEHIFPVIGANSRPTAEKQLERPVELFPGAAMRAKPTEKPSKSQGLQSKRILDALMAAQNSNPSSSAQPELVDEISKPPGVDIAQEESALPEKAHNEINRPSCLSISDQPGGDVVDGNGMDVRLACKLLSPSQCRVACAEKERRMVEALKWEAEQKLQLERTTEEEKKPRARFVAETLETQLSSLVQEVAGSRARLDEFEQDCFERNRESLNLRRLKFALHKERKRLLETNSALLKEVETAAGYFKSLIETCDEETDSTIREANRANAVELVTKGIYGRIPIEDLAGAEYLTALIKATTPFLRVAIDSGIITIQGLPSICQRAKNRRCKSKGSPKSGEQNSDSSGCYAYEDVVAQASTRCLNKAEDLSSTLTAQLEQMGKMHRIAVNVSVGGGSRQDSEATKSEYVVVETSTAQPPPKQPRLANRGFIPPTPSCEGSLQKAARFFRTLLQLHPMSSGDPVKVEIHGRVVEIVKKVLLEDMSPKDFLLCLQAVIQSQAQPHLLPFLQKSLPELRTALASGKIFIEGINSDRERQKIEEERAEFIRQQVQALDHIQDTETRNRAAAILKDLPQFPQVVPSMLDSTRASIATALDKQFGGDRDAYLRKAKEQKISLVEAARRAMAVAATEFAKFAPPPGLPELLSMTPVLPSASVANVLDKKFEENFYAEMERLRLLEPLSSHPAPASAQAQIPTATEWTGGPPTLNDNDVPDHPVDVPATSDECVQTSEDTFETRVYGDSTTQSAQELEQQWHVELERRKEELREMRLAKDRLEVLSEQRQRRKLEEEKRRREQQENYRKYVESQQRRPSDAPVGVVEDVHCDELQKTSSTIDSEEPVKNVETGHTAENELLLAHLQSLTNANREMAEQLEREHQENYRKFVEAQQQRHSETPVDIVEEAMKRPQERPRTYLGSHFPTHAGGELDADMLEEMRRQHRMCVNSQPQPDVHLSQRRQESDSDAAVDVVEDPLLADLESGMKALKAMEKRNHPYDAESEQKEYKEFEAMMKRHEERLKKYIDSHPSGIETDHVISEEMKRQLEQRYIESQQKYLARVGEMDEQKRQRLERYRIFVDEQLKQQSELESLQRQRPSEAPVDIVEAQTASSADYAPLHPAPTTTSSSSADSEATVIDQSFASSLMDSIMGNLESGQRSREESVEIGVEALPSDSGDVIVEAPSAPAQEDRSSMEWRKAELERKKAKLAEMRLAKLRVVKKQHELRKAKGGSEISKVTSPVSNDPISRLNRLQWRGNSATPSTTTSSEAEKETGGEDKGNGDGERTMAEFESSLPRCAQSGIGKIPNVKYIGGVEKQSHDFMHKCLNLSKDGVQLHGLFAAYNDNQRAAKYVSDRLAYEIFEENPITVGMEPEQIQNELKAKFATVVQIYHQNINELLVRRLLLREVADSQEMAKKFNEQLRAASTALAAVIVADHIYIVNLGNSRALALDVDNGTSWQLNEEHDAANQDEMDRLRGAGVNVRSFASPTRAVGDCFRGVLYVENDDLQGATKPPLISEPEIYVYPFEEFPCSHLLLCSVSVVKMIRELGVAPEGVNQWLLSKVVRANEHCSNKSCATLAQAVLDSLIRQHRESYYHDAHDDLSLVLVDIRSQASKMTSAELPIQLGRDDRGMIAPMAALSMNSWQAGGQESVSSEQQMLDNVKDLLYSNSGATKERTTREFLALNVHETSVLKEVVALIFQKAADQPSMRELDAELVAALNANEGREGSSSKLRAAIIEHIQAEMAPRPQEDEEIRKKEEEMANEQDDNMRGCLQMELIDMRSMRNRNKLANFSFLAEICLFDHDAELKDLLQSCIMHLLKGLLVSEGDKAWGVTMDDEAIECAVSMLERVGKMVDTNKEAIEDEGVEIDEGKEEGQEAPKPDAPVVSPIDVIFNKLAALQQSAPRGSRLGNKIFLLIAMRRNGWVPIIPERTQYPFNPGTRADYKPRVPTAEELRQEREFQQLIGKIEKLFEEVSTDKIGEIIDEFLDCEIYNNPDALNTIVSLIFRKAVERPYQMQLFASLCSAQVQHEPEMNKGSTKFHSAVASQAARMVDDKYIDPEIADREMEILTETNEDKRMMKQIELIEIKCKARKAKLDTIEFITHLFLLNVVHPAILSITLKDLLSSLRTTDQAVDDESIEAAVRLLQSCGKRLQEFRYDVVNVEGRLDKELEANMLAHYDTLAVGVGRVSGRVREQIEYLLALRSNGWVERAVVIPVEPAVPLSMNEAEQAAMLLYQQEQEEEAEYYDDGDNWMYPSDEDDDDEEEEEEEEDGDDDGDNEEKKDVEKPAEKEEKKAETSAVSAPNVTEKKEEVNPVNPARQLYSDDEKDARSSSSSWSKVDPTSDSDV